MEELKAEEIRLTERIRKLKEEELMIGHGDARFEAMKRKEAELSEVSMHAQTAITEKTSGELEGRGDSVTCLVWPHPPHPSQGLVY